MLMYADDTVILVYNHVHLQNELKALEEYCHINGR